MREELGVFPHNITSSAPLIVGDKVYANTSNGQDWSHLNIPSPQAPTIVVLDKATGKYLGEEHSGISTRLMHGSWSSPSYGEVNGKGMLFHGAGDGFIYGFDPEPEKSADEIKPLKEIWRFDCNPPEHKTDKNGKAYKYPDPNGPCEIIASPVLYKNRIYAASARTPSTATALAS